MRPNSWTGIAEIGASYYFKLKQSDGLAAISRKTLNISFGGSVNFDLNNGKAIFASVEMAHSSHDNLKYFADTSSVKIDKFAPLFAALGLKFNL